MTDIRDVRLTYYFPDDSVKGLVKDTMIFLTKLVTFLATKQTVEYVRYTPVFWDVLYSLDSYLSRWPRYSVDSPFIQLAEEAKSKLVELAADIASYKLIDRGPTLEGLRTLRLYGPTEWDSEEQISETQEDISSLMWNLPNLEEVELTGLWLKRYPPGLKSLEINIKNVHEYGRQGDSSGDGRLKDDTLALTAIANTDLLSLTMNNP
jgi:hypothetical protein